MKRDDNMQILETRIKLEIERELGDSKIKTVIDVYNLLEKIKSRKIKIKSWGKLRGLIKSAVKFMRCIKEIRRIRLGFKNELLTIITKQI